MTSEAARLPSARFLASVNNTDTQLSINTFTPEQHIAKRKKNRWQKL